MPATIETRNAHLVRHHGDLSAIYTWINDERALVLVPVNRPGAPWYVVMEGAAWTWDYNDPEQVATVARKSRKACEVLGLEPTVRNMARVTSIIAEGIPDLTRMPSAPMPSYLRGAIGQMILKADGKPMAGRDIQVEIPGTSYG